MRYQFPKGFLWGAATSAHQVEGNSLMALKNIHEKDGVDFIEFSGKMEKINVLNDWTEWEKENAERLAREAKQKFGHLPNWKYIEKEATDPQNYISGIASDHYNGYEEDFDLAKSLGHNAHRFSIEWARIEPKKGEFDMEAVIHYKNVITSLKEHGMEPFVTLWHWTVPLWLRDEGGVLSPNFSKYFTGYAEKIARELDGIKFWITINEPEIYASHSYLKGVWPPQKKNLFAFFRVMDNLVKSHIYSYSVIKKINPDAQIGIAKNNIWFEATGLWNRFLKIFADWFWNNLFLNKISGYQDFIGLNHYFHNRISGWFGLPAEAPAHALRAGGSAQAGKNKNEKISDMGWELRPESLYHCLIDLKKYNRPIYITENGLADARDKKRAWFITESLKNVHRAISEGADVRGYMHWSLMDNFEWDKGFWPRFGLIEIDRKMLKRMPRPSAYIYKKIIEDNGFE